MMSSHEYQVSVRRDTNPSRLSVILVGAGGGLAGTIVMDLFGAAALLIAGGPDTISFSLIGDAAATFFSRIGIALPGGTLLGVLLHYLIGLLLGLSFGVVISVTGSDRLGPRKGMMLAIIFVEAMSIPMLTAAALSLQMTSERATLYFATSFVMHLVFGSVLGVSTTYGLLAIRARSRDPH